MRSQPPARARAARWLRALAVGLLVLLVAGCAAAPSADEIAGAGGSSPQAVVSSFLEDLNGALAASDLAEPAAQRIWAERLAGHFAPSERADQRAAMAEMLAGFAASTVTPAVGSRATLDLSWTRIDLIEQRGERALVRVVNGVLTLRFLNAEGEVLRERTSGLTEVIGQSSGGLPTLQVGGGWFLTEG